MNHSAQFPQKPLSKPLFFAHNPEDECDGRWFHDEDQAFDHFLSYSEFYRYTRVDEADGKAEMLDEVFAERRDEMESDVQAENEDRFYQFMRESAL